MMPIASFLKPVFQNKAFVKDAGILSVGVLIAQLIALAALPIITRFYDPILFSQFGVLMSVASILAVLTTLRSETLIPVIASLKDAAALSKLVMIWASLFSLVVLLVVLIVPQTWWLAIGFSQNVSYLIVLLPALIWLVALYSCLRFMLLRRNHFRTVAQGQIMRSLTNVVVTLMSALSAWSLFFGLAFGQVAGDSAFCAMMARQEKRIWVAWRRASWARMKSVAQAQAHMIKSIFYSQIFATVYQAIPIFLIAGVFGLVPAGFYALAEKLVAAPVVLLATPIGDVYRQRATEHFLRSGEYVQTFWSTLKLLVTLFIPPFALAFLLTPFLFGPIFGEAWAPAVTTVLILLVGGFATVVCQPLDKGALIVGNRTFLPQFHAARMVLECISAALAIAGLIGFHTYLTCLVGSRVVTHLWQLYREYGFSKGDKAE